LEVIDGFRYMLADFLRWLAGKIERVEQIKAGLTDPD
jgi:hypothetical protein